MDDPIQRHPTRAEQLDILASLIAEHGGPDGPILDLGCGTGYVDWLILARQPRLRLVAIDKNPESLAAAERNLAAYRARFVAADLTHLDTVSLVEAPFRVAFSALTFHDLDDAAKQRAIAWVAARLAPGGYFLLYDRIKLVEPLTFPLQATIWRRIERLHGRGMRASDDYAAYVGDLAPNNCPASLGDYFTWFAAAGLAPTCLHLHGNVALVAGAKPARVSI
jgi:tRNA (cmo5U34)-methyltransferase